MRERLTALPGVDVLDAGRCKDVRLPSPGTDPTQGDLVLVANGAVQFSGYPTPEAVAAAEGAPLLACFVDPRDERPPPSARRVRSSRDLNASGTKTSAAAWQDL